VEQQVVFCDPFAQFDHFRLVVTVEANAFIAIFTKDQRFAMFEIDDILFFLVLLGSKFKRARIKDITVLVDFHKGRPFVMCCPFEDGTEVFDINVNGTGGECRAGTDGNRQRIQRPIHRTKGRTLRFRPGRTGGRVLTFGQTVNLVVEHDHFQIHVATQHVHEVIPADRQGITVTGDHPDLQIRVSQLDARGNRRSPAVNTVHAVGVHVIRETAGAANSGNEHKLLFGNPQSRQDFFHLGENGIIATAGAPAYFLIAGKIFWREDRQCDINAHF